MSKKRKTREEKIIAELRRKLETTPVVENVKPQPKVVLTKPSFNINPSFSNKQISILNYDYSYVKKDLSKTIFLTSVAIFAFIVLYWRMN